MPAQRCGGPWTPGPSRRGPAQAFSSIAAMYPVLASATAPAISGCASRLGPNVDGVAGRIQRSELLPSRDAPAGLSNRARRTPRSWRGLPPRRSPTLGVGAFRRRGTVVSGEKRPVLHTGAVHGACGSGFSPRVAPALAWNAKNKYTPAKGV